MFEFTHKKYFFSGVFILIALAFFVDQFSLLYVLNIITWISFFLLIYGANRHKSDEYFTKRRLAKIVFAYTFIFVFVNKVVSYYYNDNYFLFSESDAMLYHKESLKMITMRFSEGISYILLFWKFEDLGAFIVTSTLYRIIDSPLILNFLYVILGTRTAVGIFNISRSFMPPRYGYMAALCYGTASFVIAFHSTGLKESFMITLIVLFFEKYYSFINKRNLGTLILAITFLAALLLFRPVITFFCIVSVGLGMLLSRKMTFSSLFLIVFAFGVLVYSYSFISEQKERYAKTSTEELLSTKEEMIKGGLQLTYTMNIVSAAVGPLPSVISDKKPMLSFFSMGLMYRVFLGFAFWLGIYYAFKRRASIIYPLLIIIFIEMISLIYILEGLELRKSLPHMPLIFLVTFWGIYQFDKSESSNRQKTIIQRLNNGYLIAVIFVIIAWNFRNL